MCGGCGSTFSPLGIERKKSNFQAARNIPRNPRNPRTFHLFTAESRTHRPTMAQLHQLTRRHRPTEQQMNDDENHGLRQLSRFSAHRPAAIQLRNDPRLATAVVLAYVNGADGIERAAAIEALTARAALLSDADPQQAIAALAEQLPVLNAMFLVFTAESVATKNADARANYVKLALSSQSAYARTQALVIGLRLQSKGNTRVTLTDAVEDGS